MTLEKDSLMTRTIVVMTTLSERPRQHQRNINVRTKEQQYKRALIMGRILLTQSQASIVISTSLSEYLTTSPTHHKLTQHSCPPNTPHLPHRLHDPTTHPHRPPGSHQASHTTASALSIRRTTGPRHTTTPPSLSPFWRTRRRQPCRLYRLRCRKTGGSERESQLATLGACSTGEGSS